jgi:hypothetical protein
MENVMLERITINLSKNEKQALEIIATAEMRNLREQARFILCQELEKRGLLQVEVSAPAGENSMNSKGSSDVDS